VMTYAGLCVEDGDADWIRDRNIPGSIRFDSPDWMAIAGFELMPCAGYYVSTNADIGDDVFANYGTQAASMEFDNINPLSMEVMAHWPPELNYGGASPTIQWQMYPGADAYDPYNYPKTVPADINWDKGFVLNFDIDPSVPIGARDAPTNLAQQLWNKPSFYFSDVVSQGRYVTFDYQHVVGS
jgi:hypothetical protein